LVPALDGGDDLIRIGGPGEGLGNVIQRGSASSVRITKPIPEIIDYRKIAIGVPVVQKMELLLSPEPGKSSQP
jgi:hypothetical protein